MEPEPEQEATPSAGFMSMVIIVGSWMALKKWFPSIVFLHMGIHFSGLVVSWLVLMLLFRHLFTKTR